MKSFKILSDSACDMPEYLMTQHDITLVPFYSSFDGTTYLKENVELTLSQFYKTLRKKSVFPKTSLPSVQDYTDCFKPYLEQDLDIFCVCLSSKLSGSYQSALTAGNIMKEEYPDSNIFIIDSESATLGQCYIIIKAAQMKQNGVDVFSVNDYIGKFKKNIQICLTVDTLDYLQKGGRIGMASALAGSFLSIKPILQLKNGELVPHSKVRGRKKAVSVCLEIFDKDIGENGENFIVGIIHSNCIEEALKLKERIQEKYNYKKEIYIGEIGVTIGSHVGPDVLAIAYAKEI